MDRFSISSSTDTVLKHGGAEASADIDHARADAASIQQLVPRTHRSFGRRCPRRNARQTGGTSDPEQARRHRRAMLAWLANDAGTE